MRNDSYPLKFYPFFDKRKKMKKLSIYVRGTINRLKAEISTRFQIDQISDWDETTQRIKIAKSPINGNRIIKIKILLLVFCYGFLHGQKEPCEEYDSLKVNQLDTNHFAMLAFCKTNMNSHAKFTFRKQGKNNVFDGRYTIFYGDTIKEEGEYSEGKRIGTLIRYYGIQRLKNFIIIFNDSLQNETDYYPNGIIRSNGLTKNGAKVGFWCEYYENGMLREKGRYYYVQVTKTNLEEILKKLNSRSVGKYTSLRDGEWEFYEENGRLLKKEKYVAGVSKDD
ncbi:MAG: hypothetical protein JNL60_16720 [Bacteroidia bacterium]|nr:hypothetical protein [Bacteroidia bacterium]